MDLPGGASWQPMMRPAGPDLSQPPGLGVASVIFLNGRSKCQLNQMLVVQVRLAGDLTIPQTRVRGPETPSRGAAQSPKGSRAPSARSSSLALLSKSTRHCLPGAFLKSGADATASAVKKYLANRSWPACKDRMASFSIFPNRPGPAPLKFIAQTPIHDPLKVLAGQLLGERKSGTQVEL